VFKAMFDRTRDWADIEALVANDAIEVAAVSRSLRKMLPADDPRFARLKETAGRAAASGR
jgi:hypothetical protein